MHLRIAEVSPTFPPYYAGSGNVCFHQSRALAARGHEVEVFTAAYQGVPQDPPGVRVHRYAARVRLGLAPFVPQLVDLHGFDVVHLHQPFIFGTEMILAARRRAAAPLVSSYHNELVGRGLKRLLFAGYEATVTRAAMRASDRLTVLSMDYARTAPQLAAELVRRPDAFFPVPNGVDTDVFHPGKEPELRSELGLADGTPVAVICAQLDGAHPFKRPDLAIAALTKVPELALVVVGGGPLLERHRAAAARLGVGDRVHFAGSRPHADVARFLRMADLVVVASTFEPFGMVQIEGMASGRPVVMTRVPGARGVSHDGVHAIHVEPGSVDDLARGVRELLEAGPQRWREMGVAGREHVLRNFTWERGAELLESAFAEAIAARAKRRGSA